jgi:lysozyme family protein
MVDVPQRGAEIMNDRFHACWAALLGNEGGYVDNPADPGGATNWGITQAVARAHGYAGDMRELPQSLAESIAKAEYWDAVQGDQLPAPLDFQVLDGAYNSGTGQSARWLQRLIGVAIDGDIGPLTIKAVQSMCELHGVDTLILGYNAQRLDFLTSLNTWETFGRGWANRIAHNLELAQRREP